VTRLQLLSSAVIMLVAQAASAADSSHVPTYKAPITAPVYNWTGLYVGGNVGLGWGKDTADYSLNGVPIGSDSLGLSGIIGGFQAGYNLQSGNWVFGLETDIQGSGQMGNHASALGCGTAPCSVLTQTYADKLPWFGTVRGRIGFTPANGWLLYTTGGLAYGALTEHGGTATAFTAGAASTVVPYTFLDTKLGWALGVGVEAALTGDWTWKLEYLYLKPEDATQTVAVPGVTFTANGHAYDNMVRAGLNYRFGWDGPVVGK
jgi:outer membrane immunogenic protein